MGNQTQSDAGSFQNWLRKFDVPRTWGTVLLYFYLNYVGMVLSYFHFESFGVNIFEYSEINDFLLAGFRDLQTMLGVTCAVVIIIVLTYLSHRISVIAKNRFNTENKFVARPGALTLIASGYILAVPFLVGIAFNFLLNSNFLCDENRYVAVEYSPRGTSAVRSQNLVLLGITDDYVIFIGPENKPVIIPEVNLLSIRHRYQAGSTSALELCLPKFLN